MGFSQEEDFTQSNLLLHGSRTPEERFSGVLFPREVKRGCSRVVLISAGASKKSTESMLCGNSCSKYLFSMNRLSSKICEKHTYSLKN
jgi:hypothetical protein